mgnify:CR=1 FL=1
MTDGVSVDNLADDESIPAESVSSVEPKSGRNRKKEGRLGNREYFQIVEGVNALQRAVAGVSGSVARSCEVFEWLGCLLVR